eukprot:scaffold328477_cov16-Prasinocladus_malaysianus.AAC.1
MAESFFDLSFELTYAKISLVYTVYCVGDFNAQHDWRHVSLAMPVCLSLKSWSPLERLVNLPETTSWLSETNKPERSFQVLLTYTDTSRWLSKSLHRRLNIATYSKPSSRPLLLSLPPSH